jgi:4-hydroxy-2-oxoheptanedioate aldolase
MLGSPFAAELAANQQFDYVVVDCQHGLNGQDRLIDIIGRWPERGPLPLVRVPSIEAGWVGRALDAGAAGVIVPMVNSRREAEAAAAASRFAPHGVRSYGPIRPYRHLGVNPSTVNDNVLCFVMIETLAGLECVDDICATPGIDGVYVGPADLALSLKLHPSKDSKHPVLVGAIREIRDSCRRNNVVPAIHAMNGAMARTFLADGFRMVTAVSDLTALRTGLARELLAARAGMTPLPPASPTSSTTPGLSPTYAAPKMEHPRSARTAAVQKCIVPCASSIAIQARAHACATRPGSSHE